MGKITARVYKYPIASGDGVEECYEPEKKQENKNAVLEAFSKAQEKLQQLCKEVALEDVTQADIFEAQLCILEDEVLVRQIQDVVEQEGAKANYAIEKVFCQYIEKFERSRKETLRDKVLDLLDVKRRVLRECVRFSESAAEEEMVRIQEDVILVAKELLPSDLLAMNTEHIKGIIVERGSQLSHVAILARARRIPIVTGAEGIWERVEDGQLIEQEFYQEKTSAEVIAAYGGMLGLSVDHSDWDEPDAPYDLVGLYRTEFQYIKASRLPTEEELFENYKMAISRADGKPVTFRTIDFGEDKTPSYLGQNKLRGIEYCFAHPEIFRTQLRAILRASVYGRVMIMFPMVRSMEDICLAKAQLQEVMKELEQEGTAFDKKIFVGVMIETCELAQVANQVVHEVDFASVGTNDLLAAVSGVPRMEMRGNVYNEKTLETLFAILKDVFGVFIKAQKAIYVCGEMAACPEYAKRFLQLGATGLSIHP